MEFTKLLGRSMSTACRSTDQSKLPLRSLQHAVKDYLSVWRYARHAVPCLTISCLIATTAGNSVAVELVTRTLSPKLVNVVSLAPDYSASVSQLKSTLSAEKLVNPQDAKAKFEAAANRLEQYLNPNSPNGANWLKFLRWNELKAEIAKPEPDPEELVQYERNMQQNYPGLEYSVFKEVRYALNNYIRGVRFGGNAQSTLDAVQKRLDQLTDNLKATPAGSDLGRQRDIEFVLSLLDQTHQSPELIRSVRNEFDFPNINVLATNSFIRNKMIRPVDQQNPVNEVILGTHLCGTSCLVGSVTTALIDNPHQATLCLTLNGDFSSRSVGTNRGVHIQTRGQAHVTASEMLSYTPDGLSSTTGTYVSAPLQSTILSIDHPLKIVRKIAAKKAAEQKPQADAIGRSRLENRIRNQFHAQVAEQLESTNSRNRGKSFQAFDRIGLERPDHNSRTTTQYLSMLWKQQGAVQLAAPAECPLPPDPQGLSIQIHQSALINIIDPVLSGRIIRNSDLDDFAIQFGIQPSQELRNEATGEPWSITMAGFHPAEVEFDDGVIKFRIRTTKLVRGNQPLQQNASIEATYRPIVADNSIQFERVGPVKIDFVGRGQGSVGSIALKNFLAKKFESIFKPQLLDKPLRPTERLPMQFAVNINELQIDEGWMQAILR